MATPLQTPENVLTEIVETLECPVCLNTISKPPVYSCNNDHIFCGECHGQLRREGKDCPVCRQPLPAKRAFFAEKIIAMVVTHKCQNEGCEFQAALPGQLETHQDSCQLRLVKCYICSASVTVQGLRDHVVLHSTCGGSYQWFLSTNSMKTYYSLRTPGQPMACTHIWDSHLRANFFFFRYLFEGRYLFWVSHCQGKGETGRFEYTISILCGKKTFRLVQYTGLCPPSDTPLATMEKDQTCLTLPEDFIKKAADICGNYWCEFKIVAAKYSF